MNKVAISFIVLGGSFMLGSNLVSANTEEVIYDLDNHQLVESFELEENGELVDVTIIDNSLFSRMADKTYTVSKSKKNSWSISYKVTVKRTRLPPAKGGIFLASQGGFQKPPVLRIPTP